MTGTQLWVDTPHSTGDFGLFGIIFVKSIAYVIVRGQARIPLSVVFG
jgi:hypothetical protein